MRRGSRRLLPGILSVAVALVSCSTQVPSTPRGSASGGAAVVLTSFNFPESTLLAEIYAGALQHAGIPVRRQLDLGPRELVEPALRQHMVDLVPEYLGTALTAVDPRAAADRMTAAAALADLRRGLARWDLTALEPSAAQDQNGFAVTSATARRLHLRTLSDLAAAAPRLALGGPSECPQRPFCLAGLRRVYGTSFRRFVPIDDDAQRATALSQGVIDVEVTFTTDGELATGQFLVLQDDKRLQPVESVLPVVSRSALQRFPKMRSTLDAVSRRLTSTSLRFLNWRVEIGGHPVRTEAHDWLTRHGLLGTQ